jgi:hypothetical protein
MREIFRKYLQLPDKIELKSDLWDVYEFNPSSEPLGAPFTFSRVPRSCCHSRDEATYFPLKDACSNCSSGSRPSRPTGALNLLNFSKSKSHNGWLGAICGAIYQESKCIHTEDRR